MFYFKKVDDGGQDDVKNRDSMIQKEHKKQLDLDKLTINTSTNREKIVRFL
jgi:hypothetical protein